MKQIIIGLTGPTGAGKSCVSAVAEELGFKIIDCDKLARIAVEKGTAGLSALVKAFGEEILQPDGSLDRKALAKEAFKSPENTELLNKTLLPHIVLLMKESANTEKVLLDAPTLYESGIENMCTAVIAVLADEETRLKRIIARDGIDEAAARLRISAGKTDEFYKSKTDYIIYNNSEQNDFKGRFRAIIEEIAKENNNG